MRIEFTYRVEDLKETLRSPQTAAALRAQSVARWTILFGTLALCVIWIAYRLSMRNLIMSPSWSLQGTPIDVASDILPGAVLPLLALTSHPAPASSGAEPMMASAAT